jgi:hypothetical protein
VNQDREEQGSEDVVIVVLFFIVEMRERTREGWEAHVLCREAKLTKEWGRRIWGLVVPTMMKYSYAWQEGTNGKIKVAWIPKTLEKFSSIQGPTRKWDLGDINHVVKSAL